MAPLEKVQSGQPLVIRAGDYNAMIDAARDFRRRQQSQSWLPSLPGETFVRVKNNTGANRSRFEVVGLGDPMFDPAVNEESFKDQLTFIGELPTVEHQGKFALLQEPVLAGGIGRACLFGVCQAKVIITDESYSYAEVFPNVTAGLYGGENGSAQILWKQSGTGLKWAVVHLGGRSGSRTVNAKITSATPDGTGQHRWKYGFVQIRKTAAGYGGWTEVTGGITGTAYHRKEDINSSSATVLGNGVSASAMNSEYYTAEYKPVPVGQKVLLSEVSLVVGGTATTEYWFDDSNGIDVVCTE